MAVLPRDNYSADEELSTRLIMGFMIGIAICVMLLVFCFLLLLILLSGPRLKRAYVGWGAQKPHEAPQIDLTVTGQGIKYSRISELTDSELPTSPNDPLRVHNSADDKVGRPVSELSRVSPPAELYRPPPESANDVDGGRDYSTAGRIRRRDAQRDRISEPLEIPTASQDQAGGPAGSYGSDVTAVELGSPAPRSTKDIDVKRILGLDSRTFLDKLPHLEAARSSNRQHISSVTSLGISPWDVEYRPNPVIFPHLAAVSENHLVTDQQTAATGNTAVIELPAIHLDHAIKTKLLTGLDLLEELARSYCSGDSSAALGRDLGTQNPYDSQLTDQLSTIGDNVCTEELPPLRIDNEYGTRMDITELGKQDGGAISYERGDDMKAVGPMAHTCNLTPDDDLYSMSPARWEYADPRISMDSSVREETMSAANTAYKSPVYIDFQDVYSSTDSFEPSLTRWHSSPGSVSTAPSSHAEYQCPPQLPRLKHEEEASTPSLSPISILYTATPEYPCPALGCTLIFRTPGQRTNHHNRKHNLRFLCTLAPCTAAFGLRADLERHKRTVHKQLPRGFKCGNPTCTTPDKIHSRRDNFARHVKRCRTASVKAHIKGKR